jgi:prepilin-type N-terminal cleavage/methylation domain-containing protein
MFLRKRNLNKGFTLVELLVTISIFVVLTGVVLFNQSKFNSTILLTNLAYDTALTIRQAQNYGINIKEFNAGIGGESVFVPYGVHFDISNAINNKSFILFADINSQGKFNSETLGNCIATEGCVNRYSIKRGNFVSDLTVTKGNNTSSTTVLDITFKRPNPDAIITSNSVNDYSKATIYLTGVDGSTRKVNVQANGLIEIVQ